MNEGAEKSHDGVASQDFQKALASVTLLAQEDLKEQEKVTSIKAAK